MTAEAQLEHAGATADVERASARIDGEVVDAPCQKVAALVAAPALAAVAAGEESESVPA